MNHLKPIRLEGLPGPSSQQCMQFPAFHGSAFTPIPPDTSFVLGTPPGFSLKVPPHLTLCLSVNGITLKPIALKSDCLDQILLL